MSQVGSPKLGCSSPARVRHNPYAASPSSPLGLGTPVTGGKCGTPSLSGSFASATPLTPPFATPPAANWNVSAPPAAVSLAADGHASGFQSRETSFQLAAEPMASFPSFVPSVHEAGLYIDAPAFYPETMHQPAYESVDPAVAVMMYSAHSAAANAAASGSGYEPHFQQMAQQQQMPMVHMQGPMHGQMPMMRGGMPPRRIAERPADVPPTFEDLQTLQGQLVEQARTASGSSFIQAAVKDNQDPRCLELVWGELAPALGDLLLDAHGCYVIKTLLERLPQQQIAYVLQCIAADEQLGFSICTHSLHTRRVVQHIIENLDGGFLCDLMSRHCSDVAMTQQGCIVMQRSMDHAPPGLSRDKLYAAVCSNLVGFAKDPFANYVVQHLMEIGERNETSASMWKAFQGRVVELACNKFASNVIEKCLFHCTAEIQHEMLVEMYSVGPQMLYNMLQDSFGNYIIQSSIALATYRDIAFIDEQLRPVLAHTPYGHKIEGRLERRLKGKPVTARGPSQPGQPGGSPVSPAPLSPAHQPMPQPLQAPHHHQQQREQRDHQPRGNGRQGHNNHPRQQRHERVPAGEVPW
jgi:hypothetical protein